MRKDELRKLRALPATPEMMTKGKAETEIEEKSWYTSKKAKKRKVPLYDILLRVQNLNGYVKIALFLPADMKKGIKTPRYEIFLNVKGNEYITRELDEKGQEKRWLTAMVCNLPDLGYWGSYGREKKIYLNNDGRLTLNRLKLSCAGEKQYTGFERLRKWQQEQKDADTKRREAAEQAPWDADMKLVPKLLKGFEEWMRREVASKYYMIYEYDTKGQKTGYCTRCKKYVPIKNPKHGNETKCMSCKVKAIFKAHSRLQTLSTGGYDGEIIQKISGGIVIRAFEQIQWYRGREYTNPHISTKEFERILIFDNGTVKRYAWDSYKQKYCRWILDKGYYAGKTWYGEKRKLYKKNFAVMKKHSILRKSAIDLWDKLPIPTSSYLAVEAGNPAIEMLARIGMFRLAKDIIKERYDEDLIKQDETEIAKLLKIDNSRLKRLKEMDGNIYSLRWMQYEKLANTIWPDEMIKDFGEAMFETSVFGFLAPHQLSFVKCHNYLKKQAALTGESLAQTKITWEDYINMADKLKMDTKCDQIARPKDIKYAHDEVILLNNRKGMEKTAKEIEKKWPKVNKQLPKLQKYEYTYGDYMIVAPKSVLDIVIEGNILRHCVHTCDYYFSRIQTDESYLFFLRKSKSPDMPWYTLEVEPSGNIRQKRTTGDNKNEDFKLAVPFLKKWQRHFKKQLTEEEKKLGEKANELRKENYRNLRKNGNKVWHGRLAGKLLADVLEADFMEAK